MKPCLFFLTCQDKKEAEIISDRLLVKKLVACIKKVEVASSFLWKSRNEEANEILLIMDGDEALFEKVESEIKEIHSYDTFVLIAIPVVRQSKGVKEWLESELLSI